MRTEQGVKDIILGIIAIELGADVTINRQVRIAEKIYSRLEREKNLIVPHYSAEADYEDYKAAYLNWRTKYFTRKIKVLEYESKAHKTMYTADDLHRMFYKAMKESPFVAENQSETAQISTISHNGVQDIDYSAENKGK